MNAVDLNLPKLMQVVFDAGGMDAVVKLSKAVGGKFLHIPKPDTLPDSNILVQAAGRKVALAICNARAGEHVEFPRGVEAVRLHLVAALMAEGKSTNQIAAAIGVTWRHARRLRKQVKHKTPARALAEAAASRRKELPQLDIEDYIGSGAKPPRKK